jgi:hypothetical protein
LQTYERNGILMVRATGEGISVSTEDYLRKVKLSGWLWKIPATTRMPSGLALNPDPDPRKRGHFLLCPVSNTTMDKYRLAFRDCVALREDKNDMTTNAPPTTTVTLTLSRKATRYVLEALQMLENRWLEINQTSTDEDEQADYGNDALDLYGTRESIQIQAVEAFGPGVTNFSREPFPASSTPNGEHPRPPR